MSVPPESVLMPEPSSSAPAEPPTRKKRPAADGSPKNPEEDHRKRRRNRTTQSCVNCHTSKRMCDRKRPCGRCTQLGLTGLCVYEVDDPNQRNDEEDEKSRLLKRVAELEGVIREMKNKPHPRWAQSTSQPGDSSDKWHARSRSADVGCQSTDGSQVSSPSSLPPMESSSDSGESSSVGDSAHIHTTLHSRTSVEPYGAMDTSSTSSSGYHSSFSTPSPFIVPSPLVLTPRDDMQQQQQQVTIALPSEQMPAGDMSFASMLPGQSSHDTDEGLFGELLHDMFKVDAAKDNYETYSPDVLSGCPMPGQCGCMAEPPSYNVVLELTLRLRKAANLLGNSARHGPNSSCLLYRSIAELDAFVATTLGNMAPPMNDFSFAPQSRQIASNTGVLANAQFHHTMYRSTPTNPIVIAPQSPSSFPTSQHPVPSWNDSFTLWAPPR